MSEEPTRVDELAVEGAPDRVRELLELFPEVASDGKVDLDKLRVLLDQDVEAGPERYGLTWPGKKDAMRLAQKQSTGTLNPMPQESVDWGTTKNVIVEGDNLEVLKLLQKSYYGQVDLIYIDPPYNTGNDFVYDDKRSESEASYYRRAGQVDARGMRTTTNRETSGRFHSDWLSMMYPRMVIARNLLADDGVLFASIDDNEVTRLRAALDEVFGEENFIAQLIWAAGRKNDSRLISESHEYMLVVARSKSRLLEATGGWRKRKSGLEDIYAEERKLVARHGEDFEAATRDLKKWFKTLPDDAPAKRHRHYSNIDHRGVYFASDISWPGGGGPKYELLHPRTGNPVTIPSRGFLYQQERMAELVADDRVHFGPDETAVPAFKAYLRDRESEVPYSVFYKDGRGATKRLRTLLGSPIFQNPKDEELLQDVMSFATTKEALVMDFFAGSGSTAHAVLNLNAQDGGKRRYILVQLDEETGDPEFPTIADITRERVQRAGAKIAAEHPDKELDVGFRAFKLSGSNFSTWDSDKDEIFAEDLDLFVDNLKADATDEQIVHEILLKAGVRLDAELQRCSIAGKEVCLAEGGAVVVSAARRATAELIDGLAALDPAPIRVVLLDSAFGDDDSLKINAQHRFAARLSEDDPNRDSVFRTV